MLIYGESTDLKTVIIHIISQPKLTKNGWPSEWTIIIHWYTCIVQARGKIILIATVSNLCYLHYTWYDIPCLARSWLDKPMYAFYTYDCCLIMIVLLTDYINKMDCWTHSNNRNGVSLLTCSSIIKQVSICKLRQIKSKYFTQITGKLMKCQEQTFVYLFFWSSYHHTFAHTHKRLILYTTYVLSVTCKVPEFLYAAHGRYVIPN